MVLNVAGVELVIRAADVELGVTRGELECEHALVDRLLFNGSPEVGVLFVTSVSTTTSTDQSVYLRH